MMRGLVMDFNGDDNVYDIKDQWMFGPALMACPVGEYQKYSRNVYLPKQKAGMISIPVSTMPADRQS